MTAVGIAAVASNRNPPNAVSDTTPVKSSISSAVLRCVITGVAVSVDTVFMPMSPAM